jgi:hypothetical protein
MHGFGLAYRDDDEDEEIPNPLIPRDAIQGDREGSLSRCCRDDTEACDQDSVEVDRPEVFRADGLDMSAEAERDDVCVDADADGQG